MALVRYLVLSAHLFLPPGLWAVFCRSAAACSYRRLGWKLGLARCDLDCFSVRRNREKWKEPTLGGILYCMYCSGYLPSMGRGRLCLPRPPVSEQIVTLLGSEAFVGLLLRGGCTSMQPAPGKWCQYGCTSCLCIYPCTYNAFAVFIYINIALFCCTSTRVT